MNRLLSLSIFLIMALTIFMGVNILESHASTVITRTGDDGITWTLDSEGTLTLSGHGAMDDIESGYATGTGFAYEDDDPLDYMKWHVYKNDIKKIVVESGITRIGQYAFYGCQNVTSISIPEGVQVGGYAFGSCTGLTEVSIPDNVSFPGLSSNLNGLSYAFKDCTKLQTLIVGKSVDLSAKASFMGCSALSNLTLGNGDTISSTTFKDDSAIANLTIDTGTEWAYDAFAWCDKITTATITGTGTFEIVPYDGYPCSPWYWSNRLSTVNVTEGVTGLGQWLFYDNTDTITKVTLPSTLTTIGDNTFENVDATFYVVEGSYADTYLNNLGKTVSYAQPTPIGTGEIVDSGTCGEGVTWTLDDRGKLVISGSGAMDSYSDVLDVPWWTFEETLRGENKSIKSVKIEEGVTSIGINAFGNCLNLKSITLPQSLTSIGKYAFSCTSLSTITVPEGVTSIGVSAFCYCERLKSISLPQSLKSIGKYAFEGCTGLSAITIPGGVTSIGAAAFESCSCLSSITISEGVTSIGVSAFCDCKSLKSISLPQSLKSIGDAAFDNCKSLAIIIVPKNVTSIGDYAFNECVNLKSVELPQSLTSIGNYAFHYCKSLKSISLPQGLRSIGKSAFDICERLTSITVPKSVTSIGNYAFLGNESLIISLECKPPAQTAQYAFGEVKAIRYHCTDGWTKSKRSAWERNSSLWKAIHVKGKTKHYKKAAGLLKNGSEYDYCAACKTKFNVKALKGYAKYYVKSLKVKAGKKAFTATWKKQSKKNQKKFNGYQIRYSLKSNMSGSKWSSPNRGVNCSSCIFTHAASSNAC